MIKVMHPQGLSPPSKVKRLKPETVCRGGVSPNEAPPPCLYAMGDRTVTNTPQTTQETKENSPNGAQEADGLLIDAMMIELVTTDLVAHDQIKHAIHEHFSAGGKRIRAHMALMAGVCLQLDAQSRMAIAACCELLHNASLIHDDIQDADTERRDQPSLWARYGRDLAICAGDQLISAAYAALAQVTRPDAVGALIRLTHRAVSRTVAGQNADLSQTGQALDDITLYETIAGEKSGPLLGLPVVLPLFMADALADIDTVDRLVRLIAIAYQFVDDIGDWREDQAQGSLNGVLVLCRAHQIEPTHAIQEAASLTRQHLQHARELAATLPQGCGVVFDQLADRLDAKLAAELDHAA